jgi:uncharacterized membrane protein YphA (DoxX/SURF4 family)
MALPSPSLKQLAFLVAVTPIMHNFWDLPPETPEYIENMIAFFKNLSLAGSLLFYLGMKNRRR